MTEDRTKALFLDLLDVPAEERDAKLVEACRGDEDLRARVAALFSAHRDAGGFLDAPATWRSVLAEGSSETIDRPGDRIGGFELIEPIGEGGFGTVWRARQTRPIARDVALKIVKLGMDTAEVVRRFEHEQEALARMDHPHVARVFDGGATTEGRPWFAMELVDGEPITDYCDRRAFDLRRRLALFAEVCRAIQHAHHKGIIHRDVKPSNVLVATRDGDPVPRVIDFGIAKALDRAAAQHSMLTTERRLLGTPEYMSPEQVTTQGADVDAQSDVYSLGVLAYELVTGSRPFDLRRMGRGQIDELLRCIREVDAPRPSARLASLDAAEALAVADARGTTIADLRRHARGDIDWILVRALEKDRQRRYATPAQLAADIDRCLRDEPVTAGPPGLGYRLGKLARRHRTAFAVIVLTAGSLVAGTAIAVRGMWLAQRAEAAERVVRERAERGEAAARDAANRTELAMAAVEQLMTSADPRAVRGPDYTVRQMLDDFASRLAAEPPDDPLVEARIRGVIGRTYRHLGEIDAAAAHLGRALEIHEAALADVDPRLAGSRSDVAWLQYDRGHYGEAIASIEPVVAFWRLRSDQPAKLAGSLSSLAAFRSMTGDHERALAAADEALELCRQRLGADHPDTARCLARRAQVRFTGSKTTEMRGELEQALAALGRHVPTDHPELLTLRHNLGVVCETAGDFDEAEAHYRAALEGRRRTHGSEHSAVASAELALGWLRHQRGDSEQALMLIGHAQHAFRAELGDDHPHVARAMLRLGDVQSALGRHELAIATLREAVAVLRRCPTPPLDDICSATANLAVALFRSGDSTGALAELDPVLAAVDGARPELQPTRFALLVNRARILEARGEIDAAAESAAAAAAIARALWTEQHPRRQIADRLLQDLQR